MINVMVREQKKSKVLVKSCKAVNFHNGQSAAKCLRCNQYGKSTTTRWELTFLVGCVIIKLNKNIMQSIMGIVYQIKNHKNGKVYVGASTNFARRMNDHLNNRNKKDCELYQDMANDITNFSFSILEENLTDLELFERESYWIQLKEAATKGYNNTVFANNEQLSLEQVWEIKGLLSGSDLKFSVIGNRYGVGFTTISDINRGKTWFENSDTYPLRKKTVLRKKLTEKDLQNIYSLLADNNKSIKEIAISYGYKSEAVIRKINNGKYSGSFLPKEAYPIREVDSRKGRKVKGIV